VLFLELVIDGPCIGCRWQVPGRRTNGASGRYHGAPGLKINLVMALVLVAIGGAGLVYFYFIAETWSTWLATAAGMVGFAGLYWLWDEHVNAGPPSQR
jgi:hypothetical protein